MTLFPHQLIFAHVDSFVIMHLLVFFSNRKTACMAMAANDSQNSQRQQQHEGTVTG